METVLPSSLKFTLKIVEGEVKDANHFNYLRMGSVLEGITGHSNTMFSVQYFEFADHD